MKIQHNLLIILKNKKQQQVMLFIIICLNMFGEIIFDYNQLVKSNERDICGIGWVVYGMCRDVYSNCGDVYGIIELVGQYLIATFTGWGRRLQDENGEVVHDRLRTKRVERITKSFR